MKAIGQALEEAEMQPMMAYSLGSVLACANRKPRINQHHVWLVQGLELYHVGLFSLSKFLSFAPAAFSPS